MSSDPTEPENKWRVMRDADVHRVHRIAAALLDHQDHTVEAIAAEVQIEGSSQWLLNALIFEYTKALSEIHGPDLRGWLDARILETLTDPNEEERPG